MVGGVVCLSVCKGWEVKTVGCGGGVVEKLDLSFIFGGKEGGREGWERKEMERKGRKGRGRAWVGWVEDSWK